jgi:hypothetical protein
MSIAIPVCKIIKISTKKKKKPILINSVINKEKCNICKLRDFKTTFAIEYKIPIININSFLNSLKKYERTFLQKSSANESSNNPLFFKINLIFIKSLHSFFHRNKKSNFVNYDIIQYHFNNCLFKDIINSRIRNYNKIDQHVQIGLTPTFVYERNINTDNIQYNENNIKSLERLIKMQEMQLNQMKKLHNIFHSN